MSFSNRSVYTAERAGIVPWQGNAVPFGAHRPIISACGTTIRMLVILSFVFQQRDSCWIVLARALDLFDRAIRACYFCTDFDLIRSAEDDDDGSGPPSV